jgi:hypothetical protein
MKADLEMLALRVKLMFVQINGLIEIIESSIHYIYTTIIECFAKKSSGAPSNTYEYVFYELASSSP